MYPVEAFVRLVKENLKRDMTVVEVGVFNADTSVHYLPIVKERQSKAILIDWFLGSDVDCGPHMKGLMSHDDLLNSVKRRIRHIGCEDVVTIYDQDCTEASKNIVDESVDICFIDADHKYDSVIRDIKNYLPKVKSGGILCGHDCEGFELVNSFTSDDLNSDWINNPLYKCGGCHPGVIKAVYDSFGDSVTLMEDFGHHRIPVWVYRKP